MIINDIYLGGPGSTWKIHGLIHSYIYPKLSPYFYIFFAPSSGGKLQLPDEYLALDGNSLATDDLLQLGKGMYKVGTT